MFANKSVVGWGVTLATIISMSGCSSSNDSSGPSMDQLARQADAESAARKEREDKQAAEKPAAANPAEPEKRVVGRAPVAPGSGYYGAIIGARHHILNESESWAWKQAVGSFRATNGRKPKNNAEFMKKVIAEMDIPLPHKEENEEYFYDPAGETDGDFGQLYVIEKQAAPADAPASSSAPAQK